MARKQNFCVSVYVCERDKDSDFLIPNVSAYILYFAINSNHFFAMQEGKTCLTWRWKRNKCSFKILLIDSLLLTYLQISYLNMTIFCLFYFIVCIVVFIWECFNVVLVLEGNNVFFLIAPYYLINSWGRRCGFVLFPMVFAR